MWCAKPRPSIAPLQRATTIQKKVPTSRPLLTSPVRVLQFGTFFTYACAVPCGRRWIFLLPPSGDWGWYLNNLNSSPTFWGRSLWASLRNYLNYLNYLKNFNSSASGWGWGEALGNSRNHLNCLNYLNYLNSSPNSRELGFWSPTSGII